MSDPFIVQQVFHPIEKFLFLGLVAVLIAVKVLGNRLLIGEFGVFGPTTKCLLHFDLLFGLDGVQADALEVDRKLFKRPLAISPSLILLLHLIDQLANRYASNAAFPIDHIRPWFLNCCCRLAAADNCVRDESRAGRAWPNVRRGSFVHLTLVAIVVRKL